MWSLINVSSNLHTNSGVMFAFSHSEGTVPSSSVV